MTQRREKDKNKTSKKMTLTLSIRKRISFSNKVGSCSIQPTLAHGRLCFTSFKSCLLLTKFDLMAAQLGKVAEWWCSHDKD